MSLVREKLRVQFDFTPEALRRLDSLTEQSGATSRAETLRDALRLYEWFVDEADPNSAIQVINEEGKVVSSFKAKLLRK